ncbi:MAG: phage holin family protein [Thermoleophilaceae bacterium]|nr:phage holin family protein [Thermoleophilaceae bacterium]
MSDQSLGDLAKRLSEQTSTLVRQELALARAEMQEKGKRFGLGGGLLGAGGLLGLYALGALVAGLILILIEIGVDGWLSALVVAAVLAAVAGGLALAGRKQVQEAGPPAPEQAIETTRQDVEHVKERARRP